MKLRVGVIFGGESVEHEVSIISAVQAMKSMDSEKYEIISVFYSRVFYENEHEFKYYKFYKANNEEEFNNYITNIKQLSLYDTKVDAKYKDKFITLSTCEYSRENGRFVVVAKKVN